MLLEFNRPIWTSLKNNEEILSKLLLAKSICRYEHRLYGLLNTFRSPWKYSSSLPRLYYHKSSTSEFCIRKLLYINNESYVSDSFWYVPEEVLVSRSRGLWEREEKRVAFGTRIVASRVASAEPSAIKFSGRGNAIRRTVVRGERIERIAGRHYAK